MSDQKPSQQPEVDAPDALQAEKCIELRSKSKHGFRLTRREQSYITRMYHLYPDWYGATEQEAFDRLRG